MLTEGHDSSAGRRPAHRGTDRTGSPAARRPATA